jgi:hypothetical protein
VRKIDLASDEVLQSAIQIALADMKADAKPWYVRLRKHLDAVTAAPAERFGDAKFVWDLWEEDSIASTGLGGMLDLKPLLNDAKFCAWFSQAITASLPTDRKAVEEYITGMYNHIEQQMREKCGGVARLKLNRVICARYPQFMTTMASVGSLHYLYRAMGGSGGAHPIHAHFVIRERLDSLLGPIEKYPDADLDRLCLPWYLFKYVSREEEVETAATSQAAAPNTKVELKPLPAALRRRGITSVKGYFNTILELLPLLRDGLTRDEFRDEVKRINPALNEAGTGSVINSVVREFDLCINEGNTYRLNLRGLSLLDSRNPDELADHLLTRILGVDAILKLLEAAPLALVDAVRELKTVNPGWTTDFMPRAVLSWMASLDLVKQGEANVFSLTERGQAWATMIFWVPEKLSPSSEGLVNLSGTPQGSVQLPGYTQIDASLRQRSGEGISFDGELVRQLHGGLWSHPVRHFAVLTGISGSGKTQLALRYAEALTQGDDKGADRVSVIAVQPAWYDPSPLLGYVSPITNQYISAPFLDVLLRAVDDPERPYVVILDEMNLSHPEQYMAPLLSAMETRGWIDLHDLDGQETDMPKRVRYPANLALIGTVNMDETTHGLSDKVLDRAFTLEFWKIDVLQFPGWKDSGLPEELQNRVLQLLSGLNGALSTVRLHFGWRTIGDVLNYLRFMQAGTAGSSAVLDEVVYARILPKLRGENSERFRKTLEDTLTVLKQHDLKRSYEKVSSMLADLNESGMTRFWR